MAENSLLNGIKLVEEKPIVIIKQMKTPAWRWHETCPNGKIVKTDAELDKLEKEGWVNHPKKIGIEIIAPVVPINVPVKPAITEEMKQDAKLADILKSESEKAEQLQAETKRKEDQDKLAKAALDSRATVCPLCDKVFDSTQGLRLHMTKMHRGK